MAFFGKLGYLMQVAGLTFPILAILLQLSVVVNVKQMLAMLVFSIAIFWLGRFVEGYGKKG